jgi:hypothetical protein
MIFHVSDPSQKGLLPSKRNYQVSGWRLAASFVLIILLILAAYIAHHYSWGAGQVTLLKMAETVFGAVLGILLGEMSAAKELKDSS